MPTYTQIGTAQVVGSGGAASIDFSSIPSTYTDLVCVLSARCTASDGAASWMSTLIKVNGSTAGSHIFVFGDGSTAASSSNGSLRWTYTDGHNATASTFGNLQVYIPNYANTTTNKSYSVDAVTENNATGANASLDAGLVSSTSAITSFGFVPNSGSFVQYSTAYLYGVSNA